MSRTAAMRGQPLSIRLALLFSVAVVAVLLITGLAVNRLVSRGLAEELGAAQRDRISFLATQLEGVDLEQPRVRRAVEMALQRLARPGVGRIMLRGPEGETLASAGRLPSGVAAERIEEEVPGDGGLTLVIEVPRAGASFLPVFNATLLVAGGLAVAVLIGVALLVADRLTRPLRGVADAAARLGAGDLGARARGGADRESQELAAAFNAMAERLERSEALRRRAASDMAHDLATPATVLELQLQAMVDGVVPADRDELERARSSATALSGVIVQLRELVDVEAAAVQRRARRVAVADLLSEIRQALEPYFRERRVRLAVDSADPALAIEVDPSQVARALRNVLANAAQHSPAGGVTRVTVEAAGGEAVIRVADSGGGIAARDLPHIFERFYRADPARAAAGERTGGGIGLTIARELLAANGGRIEVERTGPAGTVFAVALPRSMPAVMG